MANVAKQIEAVAPTLPTVGMSRFKQIQPFLPISREKFRQLVRQGKAPQPIYLSSRCCMYANASIHEFLADPVNYTVKRD